MRPFPLALPLFLALSGCSSLSSQEAHALDLHRQNALYWYEAEDLNRARQQAARGLEIDPDDRELLLLLGWIHLKRGTREDVYAAEPIFQRVVGGGMFRGRWEKATLGLGLALRRQGDYLREAADRVERGEIPPSPSHSPPEEVARLRARSEEKVAQAIDLLEETLRFSPNDPQPLALDNLQQLYALRGDTEKSLACGKRFVDQAVLSRRFWSRKLEQHDLSAEDERISRLRLGENLAREVSSRGLMANLLFERRQFAEALAELDALLALDPERSQEYYNRARCRAEVDRKADAVADMQEFLRRTALPFDAPQVLRGYDLIRAWGGGERADVPLLPSGAAKARS